jgi:hypothetical protein
MATNKSRNPDPRNALGSTPWGQTSTLRFVLQTSATGALVNGTLATPIASGDKLVLGTIPAGFRVVDSQIIVRTPLTAAVVGDVGFEYADGVDVPAVPQDADYFGAALVLNAAGRLRNGTTNPTVCLPKDASLIVTTGGAANAKAGKVEILLTVVAEGVATV